MKFVYILVPIILILLETSESTSFLKNIEFIAENYFLKMDVYELTLRCKAELMFDIYSLCGTLSVCILDAAVSNYEPTNEIV
jgi:hypothetical protein